MSSKAIFSSTVLAAVIFTVAATNCKFPISCKCGSSNRNYKFCSEEATSKEHFCQKFSNCKSCQDNINYCLECSEGSFGPACSPGSADEQVLRIKRQVPYRLHTNVHENSGYRTREAECQEPESPKLGSIRCSFQGRISVCRGRCLPGYRFEDREDEEIVLQCSRGIWSPMRSFPPCKNEGHCDLEVVGAGSFNCTTGMTGTRCDVHCGGGYPSRYFCYPGREWEPPLPYCARRKNDASPGETRSRCRCQNGGSCDHHGQCICPVGRTGTYCETIVPERHSCPDPGFIPEGDRTNTDGSPASFQRTFTEGESVVFSCRRQGSALEGSSLLTCTSRGTWSASLPRCVRSENFVTCSDPGMVTNADRLSTDGRSLGNVQSFQAGQSVVYSCRRYYALQGSSLLTCLQTGRWSNSKPRCTRINKPPITTTTTRRPSIGRPEDSLVFCQDPGTDPNAQRSNFPALDARSRNKGFPQGSRLEYTCDEGYQLQGEKYLFCLLTGDWSSSIPTCQAQPRTSVFRPPSDTTLYCENPGPVSNGRATVYPALDRRQRPGEPSASVEDSEFAAGTRLEYTCSSGYVIQGSNSITCEGSTGFWSADPPSCVAGPSSDITLYCENPGPVSNGEATVHPALDERRRPGEPSASPEDSEFAAGTRLEYTCSSGYVIQGSYSITCELTGSWSADPPSCVVECGHSFFQTTRKITHGEKTSPGEWPWMVGIAVGPKNTARMICGGALLNRRTVITAAHCLERDKQFTLYFGKFHRRDKDDDDKVVVGKSTRILRHPNFNNVTFDSDIALIRFSPNVRFNVRIQPVCLPTRETVARNIYPGEKGYVTGWGLTEKHLQSDELMMAHLPVVGNDPCKRSYALEGLSDLSLTSNMFCAGFKQGRTSACSGDSGSPIVFVDNTTQRFTLEGIVSFGMSGQCGLPGRYTIFAKVAQFVSWIRRNMR